MDIGNFRKKGDIDPGTWDDWLGDSSPEPSRSPQSPLDTRSKHNQRSATKKAAGAGKGAEIRDSLKDPNASISIQVNMPEFRMPRLKLPWRRIRPWAIGTILLVLVLFGGRFLVEHTLRKDTQSESTPASVQAVVELGYKPIVPVKPEGEEAPKTTYNREKKLYTFRDTYLDANVTVDQQALPKSFRDNDKAVQNLADSILADDSFTTTVGEAYIHTDEISGAQRLFVYNDKMLMFIQSTKKIDTASWVEYIQSMQ